MIKKLQHRFIVIASLTVFLIMGNVLLIVNMTMFSVMQRQAFQVLNQLIKQGDASSTDKDAMHLTQNTMLNNHYFTVELDGDDNIVSSDLSHDFLLDDSDVEALVKLVMKHKSLFQRIVYGDSVFLYQSGSPQADGSYTMAFLDCSPSINLLEQLHFWSVITGLVSTLVFTVIFAAASKRAVRPLIENMESQKRFITNASHELKTPIAIISANTEMLEAVNGENEWTRNTANQTKRLSKLVEELIVLSKVSETHKADMTTVNLSAIAVEAADSIIILAEQKKKGFEKDIAENVYVMGDERMLKMFVNIFLENAVKYCDEGGTIRFVVPAKTTGKYVGFSVENDYRDGEGQNFDRFFERFYQQDESHNKAKASGFGIGLSTAQEIAALMKGNIRVTYDDGKIKFNVNLLSAKQ